MSAESTPPPGIPEEDPGTPGPQRAQTRGGGKGRRRKPRTRRQKALRAAVWSMAGVVVLGGAGLGYVYTQLNGNIQSIDIDHVLGSARPADADDGSQDILVLGSDSRSGANRSLGGGADEGGARADTAMLVHVHKGRTSASVVSIPRDTLVDRPSCVDRSGQRQPAEKEVMFNSAYSTGGAACSVKTVESMSGVRVDHFVEVDFSGFKRMVDALGGVEVTTSEKISDPESHLRLDAGTHRLGGAQALGLVRTRHAVGDGSDLGRIQLQQAFMKALVQQVKEVGVLSSPKRLYDLADTATKSVTTDEKLGSVTALASFASGLKDIGPSKLTMTTLPVDYDPEAPNRVLVDEDKAKLVWSALRHDKAIPAKAKGSATGHADEVVGAPERSSATRTSARAAS
jgi:LCP family protein required for cell wall assembly